MGGEAKSRMERDGSGGGATRRVCLGVEDVVISELVLSGE